MDDLDFILEDLDDLDDLNSKCSFVCFGFQMGALKLRCSSKLCGDNWSGA